MNRKFLFPLLALALAALACNLPFVAGTAPTPTGPSTLETATAGPTNTPPVALPPTSTTAPLPTVPTDTPSGPTPTTPAGIELTMNLLENASYHAPFYNRDIRLKNGVYSEGSPTTYSVQLLDKVAYGDMTGDGKPEAAVILAESAGGTGTFESLIIMEYKNGTPFQTGEAMLGDRVAVRSVDISQNVAHLSLLVQGPTDAMCCPSLPETQNYWLFGTKLFLMKVTTTVDNTERKITIDKPGHWTTQTNPFTVSGSVTVLPFENTLATHIYRIDGTKVNDSQVMVSPTTGTAGFFSQEFNLSSAGITDWVIIQFVDTSEADGSIIAMGSVILRAH